MPFTDETLNRIEIIIGGGDLKYIAHTDAKNKLSIIEFFIKGKSSAFYKLDSSSTYEEFDKSLSYIYSDPYTMNKINSVLDRSMFSLQVNNEKIEGELTKEELQDSLKSLSLGSLSLVCIHAAHYYPEATQLVTKEESDNKIQFENMVLEVVRIFFSEVSKLTQDLKSTGLTFLSEINEIDISNIYKKALEGRQFIRETLNLINKFRDDAIEIIMNIFKKNFQELVDCYSSTIIYHAFNNIETISNLENLDIVEYRRKLGELEPAIDEESKEIIFELRSKAELPLQEALTQFMSSGKDVHEMFAREFNYNLLEKLRESFTSIYQEEKSNQKVSNEILKGEIEKKLALMVIDYHKEIFNNYLKTSKGQGDSVSDFSNSLKAVKFYVKIEDSPEESGVFLEWLENPVRMETIPEYVSCSDDDLRNLERELQDDDSCNLEVVDNNLEDLAIIQLDEEF